jgi:hypothetical protein
VSPFACSNREWRAYHERYTKLSELFFADIHAKKDYYKKRVVNQSQKENKKTGGGVENPIFSSSPVLDLKHFRANKRRAIFELSSYTPGFLTISFLNKLQKLKLNQNCKLSLSFPLLLIPNEYVCFFSSLFHRSLFSFSALLLTLKGHPIFPQLDFLGFDCLPIMLSALEV